MIHVDDYGLATCVIILDRHGNPMRDRLVRSFGSYHLNKVSKLDISGINPDWLVFTGKYNRVPNGNCTISPTA